VVEVNVQVNVTTHSILTSTSDHCLQQSRDPRFLPVVGEFSDRKFQEQYSFLADIHTTELHTLRENVKRARKSLVSSPRNLREERQQELARLELAMKRAESSVNRDRRETIEQMALSRVTKEERDKRKQGKSGWWMKECKMLILCVSVG
jgi:ribosomal RNA-processing protein 36